MTRKEKILILEDDPNIRHNLEEILELSGYETISLPDGKSALAVAKNLTPNLILCDIMMPNFDGYDVFNEIRNDKSTAKIPFLFLTAKSEVSDIRHGMKLGADDYLIKPFLKNDLLESIKTRIKRFKEIENKFDSNFENEKSKNRMENNSTVFINDKKNPRIIKLRSILAVEATDKYSYIYLKDEPKIFFNRTLKEWENKLSIDSFIRTHRSFILNLDFIESIKPWFKKSYKVKVSNLDKEFFISERYAVRLRKNNLL